MSNPEGERLSSVLTTFSERDLDASDRPRLNRLLFLAESADDDIPDAMFKESCITEQTQYFFDNDERSYSGVLDCGNCSRYLSLQ